MKTVFSREQMETRRMIAARLLLLGKGIRETARLVGAAPSSVSRWRAALEAGGTEALKARPAPGAKPKLTQRQKDQLVKTLLRGPQKSGYANDLWTCARVAEVIESRFGVYYHVDYVGRLLHQLGWSCQRPEQYARERNDAAIRKWRKEDWPRIKKGTPTSS